MNSFPSNGATDDTCVHHDNIALSALDPTNNIEVKRDMEFPSNRNTNVRVVHNMLTKNECDNLINEVTNLGLSDPPLFDKKVRDCQRRHTVDVTMSDILFPRIRPFIPESIIIDGAKWILNRFTHHWRFVRYETGGKFIPHWDGSKLLPSYEMSIFTVQFYLNEDFEGGNTRFYLDHKANRKFPHDISYGKSHKVNVCDNDISISIQPQTGSALIFNHANESVLHDGEPVQNGIKYILRSDLLYTAVKEDIPRLLSTVQDMKIRKEISTWCSHTAGRYGTKNFIGEVWVCWCAVDRTGIDSDQKADEYFARIANQQNEKTILQESLSKDNIDIEKIQDDEATLVEDEPVAPPPRRRKSLPSCSICLACIAPPPVLLLPASNIENVTAATAEEEGEEEEEVKGPKKDVENSTLLLKEPDPNENNMNVSSASLPTSMSSLSPTLSTLSSLSPTPLIIGDNNNDETLNNTNNNICDCDEILEGETRQGPRLILLSGKRASGKDFIGNIILNMLLKKGLKAYKTSLGDINKYEYAKEMNLDYHRLLNDREYKEQYRIDMIHKHTQKDLVDPLWCIKTVLSQRQAQESDYVIICDIRKLKDLNAILYNKKLNYLRTCTIATLRIQASEKARIKRGWKYDIIKDTLPTENDLDYYSDWTAVIDNSDLNEKRGTSMIQSWISNTVLPRTIIGTL